MKNPQLPTSQLNLNFTPSEEILSMLSSEIKQIQDDVRNKAESTQNTAVNTAVIIPLSKFKEIAEQKKIAQLYEGIFESIKHIN